MQPKNRSFMVVISMLLCLFITAPVFSSSKKKKQAKQEHAQPASSQQASVAVGGAARGAGAIASPDGELDGRIAALEMEISQLNEKVSKLFQDSARLSAEMAMKLQAAPQAAGLDEQRLKKTQEIAALRLSRDKARQDSGAAAVRLMEKLQQAKRETARLEAMVIAASNQLNTLSSKRQQVVGADGGADARKAASGFQREAGKTDSIIAAKQAELTGLGPKRDQLRIDSLALETKAAEIRIRLGGDGRRLDSLLAAAAAAMNEATAKQSKIRAAASVTTDQAKLDGMKAQKLRVEAQLAVVKAEIAAATADRDRLRSASGSAEKNIAEGRAPLASLLAATESQLSEKLGDKDVLKAADEMLRLDSAIVKAKDALNGAIEQKAMRKKGADKLVNQCETDLTDLMGKLDDVKRRSPKAASIEAQVSASASAADKRKRLEKLVATSAAEIAALTMRRDQAKKNLDEFDRTHPSPAKAWAQRLGQLDSIIAAKEGTARDFAGRRDSVDGRMALLRTEVEGASAQARIQVQNADSEAAFAKKQWADLGAGRGQTRGDSLKNESTLSVGLMRLRAEQAKIAAQASALEREIAAKTADRERLKRSIADAQAREVQSKAAGAAEQKRLDSLIATKEGEVSQLSMQNEKLSETAQSASREMERELLKQGSIIAEVSAKLAAAEQEMNAISRSAEGMRKDRAAMEKFAADTLKRIGAEIAAVRGSMAAKNGELIASRNQRLALSRNLQREIGRLDSMIAVQGGAAAGLEATRDKLRRDSAAAESSIAEAALRSSLAIRRQDSLAALLQGQIAECAMKVEKALRDSITASAPVSSSAQHTVTALDTLIASKERELADLRGQREKARQDAAKDQRKQSADRTVMHQNIMNQRQAAQRRQAEMASMTAQRGKLQQDSAAALSRIQSEIKASGAEILRHTSLVAAKKAELAELTAKRADLAAKLSIMGMEPQQAAASAPASQAAASSAAAQKTVEEIYTLIGSDKIDEAVGRFNAQRSFLSASVNPEAFQVLNYAIDQAMASRKTAAKK